MKGEVRNVRKKDNQPLILRGHVSNGNGGYYPLEDLSNEERKAFGRKAVERMGKVFTDHCAIHPEAIPHILAVGEKKAVCLFRKDFI